MRKILFVTNDAWFFVSHRLPIAAAAVAAGDAAVVVAHEDDSAERIKEAGARFLPWAVLPRGRSAFGEVRALWALARIIRTERPDVLHLITVKPVVYGGLLARVLRVPACVYAVSGLGAMFVHGDGASSWRSRLFIALYRIAIAHPNACVIFQNRDDRSALLARLGGPPLNTHLIRGSGVNVEAIACQAEPEGTPRVLMAARLLRDKGILEFVEAARRLHADGVSARFQIAGGDVARGNPAALTAAELDELQHCDAVEVLGHRDDVAELMSHATLVVLPSYREGLPRVLVEAGAACRAIVTTDVPGCRDAIEPGVTGLLVPARDAAALAQAIGTLLADPERRRAMGRAGRRLVEREMRIEKVVADHLHIYDSLLDPSARTGR